MKLSDIIETTIEFVERIQKFHDRSKRQIMYEMKRAKKKIILNIFQIFLYLFGISLFFISLIMLLSRIFPLDFVILGVSILILYIALMIGFIKK